MEEELNYYYEENDGYGGIGLFSFECNVCGKDNRFVESETEEIQVCKYCESINKMQPIE